MATDLQTEARLLAAGVTRRSAVRVGARRGDDDDLVVVEEPLEIRVDGETVAVTMRTPGEDARLAVGFLFGEGIISGLADLGSVAHCGRPGEEGYGNVIDVHPAPGVEVDIARVLDSRRFTLTTAACGVCGRRTIEDLLRRCAPVPVAAARLPAAEVARAVGRLRDVQPNFARTGGLHAAALFDAAGKLIAAYEDIGRHNAVDKTVGELLYRQQLGHCALLAVSGRASFEIVQKACAARIGVVASVSAASSLAIDLAAAAGVTMVGFVRDASFNVYAHPERLA